MFQSYRKTFWGMQCVIASVVLAVWFASRVPQLAALFFVVMQVSSLIGASWAARLRSKVHPFVPTSAGKP